MSTNVTLPVLLRAGNVATCTNPPPSTARSTRKSASLLALSLKVSLTCGPVCSVATTLVGARGIVSVGPPTGAEVELPAALKATTR